MKKVSILLIVLLLAASFVSAQEVAPSVTIKGDATATFGISLDDPVTTGFENAATASIELKLVPKATATKGTEGVITLKDFEVTIKNANALVATAPTIEAKLVFDPITVKLFSAPSFTAGNAAGFIWYADALASTSAKAKDIQKVALANGNIATAAGAATTAPQTLIISDEDYQEAIADAEYDGYLEDAIPFDIDDDGTIDYWLYIADVTTAGAAAVATAYKGLTFTVALDPLTIDLMVASDGTWKNSDNDYAIGARVSGSFDPISLTAAVFAGPFDEMDLGFTVGATVALAPVKVVVGFDGWMPEGGELGWDAKVDVGVALDILTLGSLTYVYDNAGDLDLDQQVSLNFAGLVENLSLTNKTQLQNLLTATDLNWYNETNVSYTMDGIKPYAMFAIAFDDYMKVKAGAEFTGFVENTVFTAQYESGNLSADPSVLGAITFAAKVTF